MKNGKVNIILVVCPGDGRDDSQGGDRISRVFKCRHLRKLCFLRFFLQKQRASALGNLCRNHNLLSYGSFKVSCRERYRRHKLLFKR